jgi:hypothetical protein
MYQTGCGVGQKKASNEQQGTATEQTTTYHFSQKIALQREPPHTCQSNCIHVVPINSLINLYIGQAVDLVRRFRMNKKGRQYNRQKHSPPYKKLRCDASRRNSQHHLHLDCCCCLPPPPPLFFFFIILRCLHCRQPPSLCIGWDRQIGIETT